MSPRIFLSSVSLIFLPFATAEMSQSVALGPVPLVKYSYAVSNENVRQHAWHHDTRREVLLFKVLRMESRVGGGFGDPGLQIIIAAGTEFLVCGASARDKRVRHTHVPLFYHLTSVQERLDTQNLVRWAREHERRSRQGLIPPRTEPPVQVVVKFPCIAMRYPVEPPMVSIKILCPSVLT